MNTVYIVVEEQFGSIVGVYSALSKAMDSMPGREWKAGNAYLYTTKYVVGDTRRTYSILKMEVQ